MKGDSEDLSARARRGELGPDERRRLKAALDASLEARLLHRAGCEFDAEGSALPGDDAIAERLTERLLARLQPAPARRRPRWPLVAAAAACLAGAAAAGAYLRGGAPRDTAPAGAAPRPTLPAVAPGPSAGEGAAGEAGEPPPPPNEAEGVPPAPPAARAEPPSAAVRAAPSAKVAPRAASSAGDAAELFASAGLARREGDGARAVDLYDQLQRRHPSTPESRAADMALAMLLFQRGAPARALRHFERYLEHSPRGGLAPEAMWGKSQALARLGRADEARRSLSQLLALYPDSPYATQARAKLESYAAEPR